MSSEPARPGRGSVPGDFSIGFDWFSIGVSWISLDFNGFQWIFWKFNGFQWILMEGNAMFRGIIGISRGLNGSE